MRLEHQQRAKPDIESVAAEALGIERRELARAEHAHIEVRPGGEGAGVVVGTKQSQPNIGINAGEKTHQLANVGLVAADLPRSQGLQMYADMHDATGYLR